MPGGAPHPFASRPGADAGGLAAVTDWSTMLVRWREGDTDGAHDINGAHDTNGHPGVFIQDRTRLCSCSAESSRAKQFPFWSSSQRGLAADALLHACKQIHVDLLHEGACTQHPAAVQKWRHIFRSMRALLAPSAAVPCSFERRKQIAASVIISDIGSAWAASLATQSLRACPTEP